MNSWATDEWRLFTTVYSLGRPRIFIPDEPVSASSVSISIDEVAA